MIKSYCKKMGIKRFVIMLIGNVLLGLGIAIFRLSDLGNDPFTAMNLAVSAHTVKHISFLEYANYQLIVNLVLFLIEIAFGRKLIGAGTLVNAFLLGYLVTGFTYLLQLIGTPGSLILKLILMMIGVLVCALGLSLYQVPDVGLAPYDSMSVILDKYLPKISYQWCRMFTDALCALICFLAGGKIGIGMLVATFGFGPFIQFFNKHFTSKFVTPMEK